MSWSISEVYLVSILLLVRFLCDTHSLLITHPVSVARIRIPWNAVLGSINQLSQCASFLPMEPTAVYQQWNSKTFQIRLVVGSLISHDILHFLCNEDWRYRASLVCIFMQFRSSMPREVVKNDICVEFIVGLMVMTNMVYMLCHGVAAVILIKHILEKFPSCSSFGLYLKSEM